MNNARKEVQADTEQSDPLFMELENYLQTLEQKLGRELTETEVRKHVDEFYTVKVTIPGQVL